MIIHNTKEGEYNEDLELLNKIYSLKDIQDQHEYIYNKLQYITEDYNSWNTLKEQKDLYAQLKLTEKCLGFNPKSYETWYHRYLLHKELIRQVEKGNISVKEYEKFKSWDIKLLRILISVDKRNFNCWNYMHKIYPDISEILETDVCSYTYLHYCKAVSSVSCIFTDPYDIGFWFYYFKTKEEELLKDLFYIRKYKENIEIIFRDLFEGVLEINECVLEIEVPVRFIPVNTSYIRNVKLNGKKYLLLRYVNEDYRRYYEELKELEKEECLYNNLFNMEYETDSIKINDLVCDNYEIYKISRKQ